MDPIKTLHDPALADPQVQPRFSGVATFFRAPFTQDLAQADIGVIGVPFDGGVTNRPGTRHGPRELRNQSSLTRRINTATGVQPFDLAAGARPGRLLDRAALRAGTGLAGDRGVLPPAWCRPAWCR